MDNLYIVKRIFIDSKNPVEPTFDIALPATFTDLQAAKKEAKNILGKEGYDPEFFTVYDVQREAKNWKYSDGVVVYAEGSPGEVFIIEIDTVPNMLEHSVDGTSRIQQPLYHVLQTTIEYNNNCPGFERYDILKGAFATRERAKQYALQELLDAGVEKKVFVEHEKYTDGTESRFGPDVIAHAIKEGGQTVLISVISDH